jgi:hypothetical protein
MQLKSTPENRSSHLKRGAGNPRDPLLIASGTVAASLVAVVYVLGAPYQEWAVAVTWIAAQLAIERLAFR